MSSLIAEIGEFEKTKFFMTSRYKVLMTILAGQDESKIATALFYTAAGFNLFRKDVSTLWSEKVQPIRPNIRAVGDTMFMVEGVMRLRVEIGKHLKTELFGVAQNFAGKMILGTTFSRRKSH